MKTAAKFLGIAGGVYVLLISVFMLYFLTTAPEDSVIRYGSWAFPPVFYPPEPEGFLYLSIIAASGIFGLTGGLLAQRHCKAGGVLMIIASVPTFMSLPFVILMLGGLFAMSSANKPSALIAGTNGYNTGIAKGLGISGSIFAILIPASIFVPSLFAPQEGAVSVSFYILGRELAFAPGAVPVIMAAAIVIGGSLAITGTSLVKKNNIAAGVLLLLGSVFNCGTFITFILLLFAGLYALIPQENPFPPVQQQNKNSDKGPLVTVSKVLAILGGISAILMAALFLPRVFRDTIIIGDFTFNIAGPVNWGSSGLLVSNALPFIIGAAFVAGGILGITGGFLLTKKKTAGGILVLIGAVLNFGNAMASILLLVGGIFALIPEKQQPSYPYPQYPYPQYPQYTQQPYQQQPRQGTPPQGTQPDGNQQ